MNVLQRQARSRDKLRLAVIRYAALRAADGSYTDTVECLDREGRPVTVMLRLDILAAP